MKKGPVLVIVLLFGLIVYLVNSLFLEASITGFSVKENANGKVGINGQNDNKKTTSDDVVDNRITGNVIRTNTEFSLEKKNVTQEEDQEEIAEGKSGIGANFNVSVEVVD